MSSKPFSARIHNQYSDVTWALRRLKSLVTRQFVQQLSQTDNNKVMKTFPYYEVYMRTCPVDNMIYVGGIQSMISWSNHARFLEINSRNSLKSGTVLTEYASTCFQKYTLLLPVLIILFIILYVGVLVFSHLKCNASFAVYWSMHFSSICYQNKLLLLLHVCVMEMLRCFHDTSLY